MALEVKGYRIRGTVYVGWGREITVNPRFEQVKIVGILGQLGVGSTFAFLVVDRLTTFLLFDNSTLCCLI